MVRGNTGACEKSTCRSSRRRALARACDARLSCSAGRCGHALDEKVVRESTGNSRAKRLTYSCTPHDQLVFGRYVGLPECFYSRLLGTLLYLTVYRTKFSRAESSPHDHARRGLSRVTTWVCALSSETVPSAPASICCVSSALVTPAAQTVQSWAPGMHRTRSGGAEEEHSSRGVQQRQCACSARDVAGRVYSLRACAACVHQKRT